MKARVVTMTAAMVAIAIGPAYAASETVTMNAIDVSGAGNEIGTLRLPTPAPDLKLRRS
jgi:hypothetical protein